MSPPTAIRLVLWDVDGTLLQGGGVAVAAYNRALRDTFRLVGEIARIPTAGKTDAQIAFETLALHALEESAVVEHLPTFAAAYAAELARVEADLRADLRVLPGVPALLARLARRGPRQSLLTGNFAPAARAKVAAAGLDRFLDLDVGAYGSDHRDRDRLVPIALDRLRARHGESLTPSQVVVVGDTPLDVACARAGGARAVAVATGRYSPPDLAAHAPDALLDSLADLDAAEAAILAPAPSGGAERPSRHPAGDVP